MAKATKKKVVKKKTTKKTASKKPGKQMATMAAYEKQFEQEAQADVDRTGGLGEGNKVSIAGGSFTFQGQDMGETLEVVVVNFCSKNEKWDARYDKDDLNSPACAAIGMEDNEKLTPSEDSPVLYSESCGDCEHNEWESAETGKGKACNQKKRLVLVSADGIMDDEPELVELEVPPGSTKNFKKYLKGLAKKIKRPLHGIKTEISFDSEFDYEVLSFKSLDRIEDVAEMNAVMDLRGQCEADLLATPDFSNYHVVEKKRAKRKNTTSDKSASKFAGKKTASKKATSKKKSAGKKSKFAKG